MKKTLTFNTGRVYGGNQQFLDIWFEDTGAGWFELDDVEVHFRDQSRHISGTVTIMGLEMDSNYSIGKAVLREYDAGRYTLI